MKTLLENMINLFLESSDKVRIKVKEEESSLIYELKVINSDDTAKVIGKKGKNIDLIATFLSDATVNAGGKKAFLEIIE